MSAWQRKKTEEQKFIKQRTKKKNNWNKREQGGNEKRLDPTIQWTVIFRFQTRQVPKSQNISKLHEKFAMLWCSQEFFNNWIPFNWQELWPFRFMVPCSFFNFSDESELRIFLEVSRHMLEIDESSKSNEVDVRFHFIQKRRAHHKWH